MVRPVTASLQPGRGRRIAAAALVALLGAACGDGSSDAAPDATSSPAPVSERSAESTAAPSTAGPSSTVVDTASPDTISPDTVAPTTDPTLRWAPFPGASTVADLLALDRPIVIAHAGGDFEAPHSTMYAYRRAAVAGTDVLEMDVRLTADGVLVVHHDDTVDRTANGTGRIDEMTYEELAALDNAHWFVEGAWSDQSRPAQEYVYRGVRTGEAAPPPDGVPDDFRIETFRSVATAFPDHVLDVEIKVPRDAAGTPDVDAAIEIARVLADEIEELGRTGSVVVVSFDTEVIAAFRSFAPDVATSPALATLVDWYVGNPVEFAPTDVVFQVPPVYEGVEVLTPDVVARARADGFDVWVWMDDTTDQENAGFYTDLLDRGVDGLLVSRPVAAIEVVQEGADGGT